MKTKSIYPLILIFVVSLFSSCFELVEEVTLNNDGSGEFEFTANLSQSKTKLKSIMLMDKINGHKVPSQADVTKEIVAICTLAKKTKGISKVSRSIDFENFIFSFKCQFDSVEALNSVVKNFRLSKKVTNKNHDKQFTYDKKKKILYRNFDAALKQEYTRLNAEDKKVSKGATYVSVYRFHKEVKATSNSKTKTSPNNKATMLKVNVLDVINKKSSLKNTIKLK